ncbi:MAG: hypothetical protein MJ093_03855 [Saccharofermentans sp.]|nr:hypothetical protein [Saccharofermentans sp.]
MSLIRVIGQQDIKRRISLMLNGHMPQSFLITGAEGMGKHLIAEELAKAIMCSTPNSDGACGKCNNCRYFVAGTHPDIKRIEATDGRKSIRIADLRSDVSSDIAINPQIASTKVYIINGDQLGNESQNLLLKSLEEPPKGVAFILTVSDSSRIIPTIMSRVTELKLKNYSADEIKAILANNRSENGEEPIPESEAAFIASFSSGIPGRALDLAQDESFSEERDRILDLVLSMPKMSLTDLLYDEFAFWDKNRDRIEEMLLLMLWTLGDMAALLASPTPGMIKNIDKEKDLINFLSDNKWINYANISNAAAAVTEFARGLKVNVNFEAGCCSMFLKIHKELAR